MYALWHLIVLLLLSISISSTLAQNATSNETEIYDYIVVGSGPGGGPLSANLAKAGYSVLLLEAGDDQGSNLDEEVAGFFFLAYNDPAMRWDFFVKYHSDDNITKQFDHLVWRTVDGGFYVGVDPPEGAVMLGVYYPRAGTLGGCSTHNAMCAFLPSDSDWDFIANLTGDASWSAENMLKYFVKLENNHYVPPGTPGHGFDGFLDICVNDDEELKNQTQVQTVLAAAAKASGQDPDDLFDLIQRDLNNGADPDHDFQTGIFGFPAHRDPLGRRVSARNAIVDVANATNSDGSKKYNLTVQFESLVTKVLFDTPGNGSEPRAIGVEMLVGKSMYSADPRYNASVTGETKQAFAAKEVILSGGVFNTPQILKLSGIGPKDELTQFDIPVLLDLPGVGYNLQDNNEFSLVAEASENFTSLAPVCTYGAPGDPCLEAWYQGLGPYTTGPLDALMFKSNDSVYGERDIFMWATAGAYRGYWPAETVNEVPTDPANTVGFAMVKIHQQTSSGTVLLQSSNPRDVPDINFRFFEGNAEAVERDLQALEEGVDFARGVLDSITGPLAPFVENLPCDGNSTCDVKDIIKTQTWSHHGTSSCSIGADNDPMAVLDSEFRVRGTTGLRVVDGSAFPRTPGAFPVIATFMLSEKASEVILGDAS